MLSLNPDAEIAGQLSGSPSVLPQPESTSVPMINRNFTEKNRTSLQQRTDDLGCGQSESFSDAKIMIGHAVYNRRHHLLSNLSVVILVLSNTHE